MPSIALGYLALRGGAYDAIVRGEAGLAIWAAIALGLILGVLPRGRVGRLGAVPLIGMIALALLTLLSMAWTASEERTFAELSRVVLYAGVLALALLALNRFTWRAAAGGVVAIALAISAFALATRLAPGTLPSDEVARLFDSDRLSYPFDYWNAVGAWSSMAAAMGLAWSAHTKVAWARALSLAGVPAAVACDYLSYSRAGAVGLAVGAIAILVLSRNRWTAASHGLVAAGASGVVIALIRAEPRIADGNGGAGGDVVALALVAAAIVCAAAAIVTHAAGLDGVRLERSLAWRATPVALAIGIVIALAAGGGGALVTAWDEFTNERTAVASQDPAARLVTAAGTRSDVWGEALDAFAEQPLKGIGPGTFEFYWSRNAPVPEFLRDAHSLYLEQLAELGIPGFALVVVIFGSLLWVAVRARIAMTRSSDLAASVAMTAGGIVFIVHAGVDWMWEETAVSALGITALAVMLAARSERLGGRRAIGRLRIAAVAFAALAAATQIPPLVLNARVRDSAEAQRLGSFREAEELADEAIDAEPWAASPYVQRAAVAAGQGKFRAAREDVLEAISREPASWRNRLALVQVDLAREDRTGARRAFDALIRLNRSSAIDYERLSDLEADPLLRQAALNGCLAYTVGNCVGERGALNAAAECLDLPGEAITAIERYRGGSIGDARAVESVIGLAPIYFVAGEIDGETALWGLDAAAYSEGTGFVVALNETARPLLAAGAATSPEAFGYSPGDPAARDVAACLE